MQVEDKGAIMAPRYAIISDDFTGGMMVAALLSKKGIACSYVIDSRHLSQVKTPVIVLPTRARFISSQDARDLMRLISADLQNAGVRQVFYKYNTTFDSTSEGNIGPCIDELMAAWNAPRAGFCPAFPAAQVFVHEGYLFYKGRLVSESVKRFDPLTPMQDSDLVRVLTSQTKHKVGLLRHTDLAAGREAVEAKVAKLDSTGHRCIMMDTVDGNDLDVIAELTRSWRVMSGSDALPIAIAEKNYASSAIREVVIPSDFAKGRAAVISGSCSSKTLLQLETFARTFPIHQVDILDERSDEALSNEALKWALRQVENQPLAISTSADPDTVAKIQSVHGVRGAAERAERILARTAGLLFQSGFRRFIVAGGETSGAVVRELKIPSIAVAPLDDLNVSYGVAHEPSQLSIMLKAGQLGPDDLYQRALVRM